MSKMTYPGWTPNYRIVDKVDGKFRTCMIIDLRSEEPLNKTQIVLLAERLEATVERGEGTISGLKAILVTPDQFDPVVCDGLRLTRKSGEGGVANAEVPLPD